MLRKMTAKPNNMATGNPTANRFKVGAARLITPNDRFTTSNAVIAGKAIFRREDEQVAVQFKQLADDRQVVRPASKSARPKTLREQLNHREMPIQRQKDQHAQHQEQLTQNRNADAARLVQKDGETKTHAHADHLPAQSDRVEDKLH